MTNNRLEEIRARRAKLSQIVYTGCTNKDDYAFTVNAPADIDYLLQLLDARSAVAADADARAVAEQWIDNTSAGVRSVMLNMYLDDLAQRITVYANQRGDERWREGVEAAAKIARHRAACHGVFSDFASDSAAQATATVIADDIEALLNQPADKSAGE